jgi:hypothetical protein
MRQFSGGSEAGQASTARQRRRAAASRGSSNQAPSLLFVHSTRRRSLGLGCTKHTCRGPGRGGGRVGPDDFCNGGEEKIRVRLASLRSSPQGRAVGGRDPVLVGCRIPKEQQCSDLFRIPWSSRAGCVCPSGPVCPEAVVLGWAVSFDGTVSLVAEQACGDDLPGTHGQFPGPSRAPPPPAHRGRWLARAKRQRPGQRRPSAACLLGVLRYPAVAAVVRAVTVLLSGSARPRAEPDEGSVGPCVAAEGVVPPLRSRHGPVGEGDSREL